jgi:hypothetical protein
MVRNVKTCLLKDVTNVNIGHDLTQYRRWLYDVGKCGSAFAADVPVMGSFYRMLTRFGLISQLAQNQFACYGRLSRNASIDYDTPDDHGRYSFWLQTGIHPDAQVQLEQYFDTAVWGGDKRQFINNLHHIIKNGT